jgi:hypothetical protein
MRHDLSPSTHRSEAFAEDLLPQPGQASAWLNRRAEALLGLLPLCTALLGFAFALL